MMSLNQYKKQLIMAHKSFSCRFSGEMFDYRTIHIVGKNGRYDIISKTGWEKIKDKAVLDGIYVVTDIKEIFN